MSFALKAFTEIADKNMTIDLFKYILELVNTESKYVRKKVMLSSIRILQKEPSLVTELESILPHILNEKNHGLLLCSLHLANYIIKIKPEYRKLFSKNLKNLYKVLKSL